MTPKQPLPAPPKDKNISLRVIEDEMKTSYLAYSMSVIVGRALPDARDGLKPVHRRILYAMFQEGLLHNKKFSKCAGVVGEVLKKYHPHGDAAVYDALVRLAQPWNLRYTLIQGQGNFGSVDGDEAAAYRYTEARLQKLAEELLQDIEKKTVEMSPNFDNTTVEPTVLPSKAPNLLINGSAGIAVGMATNIPPHNIKETCTAIVKLIDNPEISIKEVMEILPGPDFPTGGFIQGTAGIKSAYETGRGKLILKARMEIEEERGRTKLIVNEIPYQVNKSVLIEDIANLVRDKVVQGISDLRDESDRDGMRIVIELKSGANPDVVKNQLFAHTNLKTTFGIIFLALVNNEPKVLNIKELMQEFVLHRRSMVRKRTEFDLADAEKQKHLFEGLIIALDNLDPVIALIKKAASAEAARKGLIDGYRLSEVQAQAILDMKLQRLTGLERDKIRAEHAALVKLITKLKEILASEQKILGIIRDELTALIQQYGDERKSQIILKESVAVEEEDLIKPEQMVITVTHAGYVKRLAAETYKQQKRGGKGIIAAGTKEEDFVEHLFVANSRATLLCFTNTGKVHWLKAYQVPEAGRTAKGTAIVNLLQLPQNERITAFIPVEKFSADSFIMMATKKGVIKKTTLSEFANPRSGGIIAIGIDEHDALIDVALTDGKKEILLATANGMAVRFDEGSVRAMGRTAYGVTGIKLREDCVVGMLVVEQGIRVLTITEHGFGKQTSIDDYRKTNRAGVGVINIKITDKNGKVVSVRGVQEDDEVMLISKQGSIIRTPVKGISEVGRNTQGVRIMRLEANDAVTGAAHIVKESNDSDEEAKTE